MAPIEHRQYNIPYYTQGTRLRMLGESIQIVRSLLTNDGLRLLRT